MFRIRSSQLEHFGARSQEEFDARMVAYFRDMFAEETLHLDLDAWVARNVQRAVDRGIELEPVVAQYLLFCLLLGEDAPEKLPWLESILSRRDLAPDGKMRSIARVLRDQEHAERERNRPLEPARPPSEQQDDPEAPPRVDDDPAPPSDLDRYIMKRFE